MIRQIKVLQAEETGNKLVNCSSLWEALHVDLVPHMIISIVGAGGKTSIMYQLADELENMGKSVIVTTTTHIFCPANQRVLIANIAAEVEKVFSQKGILVTGRESRDGKLESLLPGETEQLAELCDVLLIEADGARRLPLKVPGEKEPVILPGTHLVIACAGLDSIGHPLCEVCFRWEEAAKLLHTSFLHCVTIEDMTELMTCCLGAKKGVSDSIFKIVLNKADGIEQQETGRKIAEKIRSCKREECILTSFKISSQEE